MQHHGTATANVIPACLAAILVVLAGFPILAQPGTIHEFAGDGVYGNSGDGGLATDAHLKRPAGLAVSPAEDVYIADHDAAVVRRVDHATGHITTVAGNGELGYGGDGGPATDASFLYILSIQVDDNGNLYVADQFNGRIRKVEGTTGKIQTVAGGGTASEEGSLATDTLLTVVSGVAVDPDGDLYIAEVGAGMIRRVDHVTGILTTIAGNGLPLSGGDGGFATNASFEAVLQVALDPDGNVYALDAAAAGPRVRKIDKGTGIIDTIAGGGDANGETGQATDANLGGAQDIKIDDAANLYIAGATRLWKVKLATGAIRSIAGTGEFGLAGGTGDGGPASLATFNYILGVAVAGTGDFYVSDSGNARVRRIDSDLAPFDVVVDLATPQTFLDQFSAVQGSVRMEHVTGRTQFSMPNLAIVGGDVALMGNPDLAALHLDSLNAVGGNLSIVDNTRLPVVALTVAGDVGGDVDITGNAFATAVDLTVGGRIAGSLTITDNSVATAVELDLGPGGVGGHMTIETRGQPIVDFTGTPVGGNVILRSPNAKKVSANTGGGSTSVTLVNGASTMTVELEADTLTNPAPFSIEHLDPATLPTQGTASPATSVDVTPVAAYRFGFASSQLHRDATVTFDVEVAALDAADQTTFLDAVASDGATLAVLDDAPGSLWQTSSVCTAGQGPTAGGCVAVTRLDEFGSETPPGNAAIPAVVRFSGVTNRFSTIAVARVSPTVPPADTTAPITAATITPAPDSHGTNDSNVTVTLSAADNPGGSGVASITYTTTGSQPMDATTVPGAAAALYIVEEGMTTITVSARDNAGNSEAPHSVTVTIDKPSSSTAGGCQAAISGRVRTLRSIAGDLLLLAAAMGVIRFASVVQLFVRDHTGVAFGAGRLGGGYPTR